MNLYFRLRKVLTDKSQHGENHFVGYASILQSHEKQALCVDGYSMSYPITHYAFMDMTNRNVKIPQNTYSLFRLLFSCYLAGPLDAEGMESAVLCRS